MPKVEVRCREVIRNRLYQVGIVLLALAPSAQVFLCYHRPEPVSSIMFRGTGSSRVHPLDGALELNQSFFSSLILLYRFPRSVDFRIGRC